MSTEMEDEAEQAKERQLARQREVDALRWLMGDARGRAYVWRLLSITGVYRNPYTGDNATFFRCGEMNVGQMILAELHAVCPALYQTMVAEHQANDGRSDDAA